MAYAKCRRAGIVLATTLAVWQGASLAHAAEDTDALKEELAKLREQMIANQAAYQAQIGELLGRIEELESKAPTTASVTGPGTIQIDTPGRDASLGIGFNIDAAAGGSTAGDNIIKEGEAGLQGGAHDPNRNGFTLQAAELSLEGVVDPYFDARATILFQIDQEGETVLELEEAFARTRFLPGGFQLTAGQFYSPFGRKNSIHVHAQDFSDQPIIIGRMFGGDGQRQVGTSLSWLTPLPWYSELTIAAQNSNGETMPSFGGEEGLAEFDNVIMQQRNFSDLVYTGRVVNGFDLTDTLSVNIGASFSTGPNRTGPGNNTLIYGGDIYAKWVAPNAVRGFPFVSFESEVIGRRYEAGDINDTGRIDLKDWGMYAQALYGFTPGWVAGLRFGIADGDMGSDNSIDNRSDFNRSARYRISPNVTWYPTEWSKIRFQYNHDWAEVLPGAGLSADADPITGTYDSHTADSFWIQLGVALGSHGAHEF